jgi:two-component system phosphate regulon sensor histidine kinase PhoR
MNKLAIRWLIAAMGLSLIGLITFQVYWIGSIISANEHSFKRDVQDALTAVAEKLEKKEALIVAVDNFHTNFIYKSPSSGDTTKIELIESSFEKKVIQVQDFAKDSANRAEWLSFYFNSDKPDPVMKTIDIELERNSEEETKTHVLFMEGEVDSIISNDREYQKRLKRVTKKTEYIQLAMHELFSGDKKIENRVDLNEVDSLLKSSLMDRGIDIPYKFGILDPLHSELVLHFENEQDNSKDLKNSELRANIFPNDIMGDAGQLVINFPGQKTYLMGKIWVTLASSILFIFIILVCFSYAIHTIFKQKKLSEIKNDFINNMTHEFKTPISTVSLACEALRDKQINYAEGMRERYLSIIHDENKRLGTQVEKVLQMAVIERKDFELKLETVNVHQIIEKALENVTIQVSKKGGRISKELSAINQTITADQMHLTNIIYNLLDNATKYSNNEPIIKVTTIDSAHGIFIKIIDKGIGMSKDVVNLIFEKFYRVPTGNLHDVKGFGLGLAYVKNMVEAHGGDIKVNSELEKGSEFTLYFPF